MSNFKWTEKLSVGDAEIDEDHKELFDLINKLESADKSRSSMANIIGQLEDYANEHFSREEVLMREVGFPGYSEHVKEHHAFVEWLDTVKKTYSRAAESPFLISDLVNDFLEKWLCEHIMTEDMKYRDFILETKDKQ
ncbi:MAG: bacteriohemerythrin [Gammaproteobacteria bacterium]|nr:bacteriohemerythrin [Gammaproteobacteria bacterium]